MRVIFMGTPIFGGDIRRDHKAGHEVVLGRFAAG